MTSGRGKGQLPRLRREWYDGKARVHWVINIDGRKTSWLTPAFHGEFVRINLHCASRYRLACPAYCLMPDHIHLVWMGLSERSGNQAVAMEFLRRHLRPALPNGVAFQHQAYDHVLRQHESEGTVFENACLYILDNPVRANLADDRLDWPYSGAIVPGYPDLDPNDGGYWELFWRIFARLSDDG